MEVLLMPQGQPILTQQQSITVQGKVFYNDRRRRIDVKKPIRDLFSSDSEANIRYIMELCLSEEKALQRVKELNSQRINPVLMYFTQEEGEENA